jgi:hypothetical protein
VETDLVEGVREESCGGGVPSILGFGSNLVSASAVLPMPNPTLPPVPHQLCSPSSQLVWSAQQTCSCTQWASLLFCFIILEMYSPDPEPQTWAFGVLIPFPGNVLLALSQTLGLGFEICADFLWPGHWESCGKERNLGNC